MLKAKKVAEAPPKKEKVVEELLEDSDSESEEIEDIEEIKPAKKQTEIVGKRKKPEIVKETKEIKVLELLM